MRPFASTIFLAHHPQIENIKKKTQMERIYRHGCISVDDTCILIRLEVIA